MASEMTRRSFIGAAIAAAGVTAAGVQAVQASEAATATPELRTDRPQVTFTPGTYTATTPGRVAPITVEVVFDEHSVVSIDVVDSLETPGYGTVSMPVVAQRIIDEQRINVDTFSGSSISSNALVTAVGDCMLQAGVDPDDFEYDIPLSTEVLEYTADICVIGAGGGGLMAASEAAKQGLKVIVLEKGTDTTVSDAWSSGGPAIVGSRMQKEAGITADAEYLYKKMMGAAKQNLNADLLQRCIKTTGAALDATLDAGFNYLLVPVRFGDDNTTPEEPTTRHICRSAKGTRSYLLADIVKAAGGDVICDADANELIIEDGIVKGAKASCKTGETVIVHAACTLLATGGFLGSASKIRQYFGDIYVNPLGNVLSTGAGIDLALSAGGMVEQNSFALISGEFAGANRKAGGGIRCAPAAQGVSWLSNSAMYLMVYGGLMVDKRGKRFCDEYIMASEPLSLGGPATTRAGVYYSVVDQKYVDDITATPLYSLLGEPSYWFTGSIASFLGQWTYVATALTDLPKDLQEGIEQGWVFKADTIEGLAAHFDLPELPAEVERYNGYCAAGYDDQFYKHVEFLTPIEQGPFYAIEYEPSAWGTTGGVRVNEKLQVVRDDNTPIKGLYAAGVDAGSAFMSPYFPVEGAAMGLVLSTGYIAGHEMAAEILG